MLEPVLSPTSSLTQLSICVGRKFMLSRGSHSCPHPHSQLYSILSFMYPDIFISPEPFDRAFNLTQVRRGQTGD